MNWEEVVPILDEKYGDDWTVKNSNLAILNYETKEAHDVRRALLQHVSKGTNLSTKSHCQISATNFDTVFEHHDRLGHTSLSL